jgi:hypothetical protein
VLLSERVGEPQPQEICGMFCPPDRWLVTSQPELHPGPITALTWLSPASSSPIAASPCFALHPESAQLYCNVRPGKSFLSAFTLSAASAAAPAMLEPMAHVPVVGSAARACVHQLWHCASMHACLRARVCARAFRCAHVCTSACVSSLCLGKACTLFCLQWHPSTLRC